MLRRLVSRIQCALHPLGVRGQPRRELCCDGMNKNFLLCLISIALVTSCTNLPDTSAVATAPVATPTPENYGLYTNSELQIYSETIDLKIQEALKNNNPNQAQEFGRQRQELLAEFNRRGLTRKPAQPTEPTGHSHYSHTRKHSRAARTGIPGIPGQD